jgi:CRP-like cAMP-binding protein
MELTRRLSELSGSRVESRLAQLLLKMADENRQPDAKTYLIPAKLSRQELADFAGTTIETCIRIMSRWQKGNTVHTVRDGFVILDREKLEDIASM